MINVYLLIEPLGISDELQLNHIPRKGEYYRISEYKNQIMSAHELPDELAIRLGTYFIVDQVIWESTDDVTITITPLDYLDINKTKNQWTSLEWQDWFIGNRDNHTAMP